MTVRDAFGIAIPFLIAAALVFGPVAAWQASRRLRNPAVWLALGALLGPIAIGLLLLAPPAVCPACGEPTRGFEGTCGTCGSPLASERSVPDRVSPALAGAVLAAPPTADATIEAAVEASTRAATRPAAASGRAEHAVTIAASSVPASAMGALDGAAGGGSDRWAAVGAQRATSARDAGYAMAALGVERGAGLTILAIGVYVRGSESLVAGSRYLIARTPQRLIVIGPVEASSEHVELELPLDEVEATYVPDRLVVSGWTEGRSRRWVMAFQSLAGLTASAIDEVLMATPAPREAIGQA